MNTRDRARAVKVLVRDQIAKKSPSVYPPLAVAWDGVWPEAERDDGEPVLLFRRAVGPLAVRRVLAEPREAGEMSVILTPTAEKDLGADVITRLWGRRLFQVHKWTLTLQVFGVERAAYSLTRKDWIADALLSACSSEKFPPLKGNALTEETAWETLLGHYLNLKPARPDPAALLSWSVSPGAAQKYAAAPEGLRRDLPEWLGRQTSELLCRCMDLGHTASLVPLGLVCRILIKATEDHRVTTRLEERYLGGRSLRDNDAFAWADAAEQTLRRLEADQGPLAHELRRNAETILEELGGAGAAHYSPMLAMGFESRQDRFAAALTAFVKQPDAAKLGVLYTRAGEVRAHRRGQRAPETTTVDMALRLARCRLFELDASDSLAGMVDAYFHRDAFADRARRYLWKAEGRPALVEACRALVTDMRAYREAGNKRFAETLVDWRGDDDKGPVPIENFIQKVVAPLARQQPVLLLVLDGMSAEVFHELAEDMSAQDWIELAPEEIGRRRTVAAALPTVTEISRTSLFCGSLKRGNQATERVGLETHPALRGLAGNKPKLFHKADLSEGGGLSKEVAHTLGKTENRVVAAVINTVDMLLDAGEQLGERWTVETVKPLGALLEAASRSNRTVVMTADHGHVLEWDMTYRRADGKGERYRLSGEPAVDELRTSGPRVVDGPVILPWSERVRYGRKKYGYHGGASLQEVVVPAAVWIKASQKEAPEGWVELAHYEPDWWDVTLDWEPEKPILRETAATPADWIDELFKSPVYQNQSTRGNRLAPKPEQVRACLEALAKAGNQTTPKALARETGRPDSRLRGFLSQMIRLLNVEGYQVLTVDYTENKVTLNQELLKRQFTLK
ncbi:MAG: BREX-2 system phosphatase PglZ [Acidobacteriota bacterium]|nr:BREX-2 system phosphatase PglZ [Acidobacteriota bacterium]